MINKKISVLIIEDNLGDQLLLHENLVSTGLSIEEVAMAETLQEGERYLKSKSFDLLFLDLFLPDSEGLESLLHLINLNPKIPIIVYSGLSDTQMAIKAISLGAQDFLIKGDYTNNLLEKTVRYSIERKSNLDALEESIERYNLVRKATHDMVWDWNISTNKVYRNPDGLKNIFNTNEIEEVCTKEELYKNVHPKDYEKVEFGIRKAINTPDLDLFETEYRIIKDDGSVGYIEDRCYIIRNETGKATRLIGAWQDVTRQKELEEKVEQEKIIKQKQITEAVYATQEKERSEIGREMHDNINQLLGASKLYIDVARKNNDTRDEMLKVASSYTLDAIEEIRKLSKILITPLIKEIGLTNSLKDLIEEIMLAHPIQIEIIKNNISETGLSEKFKLNIFRIMQEQTNNILKHAQAKNIFLSLFEDCENILFTIEDNGVGFDVTKRKSGVGLTNIKSRSELFNGKMLLLSEHGKGTKLTINFKKADIFKI